MLIIENCTQNMLNGTNICSENNVVNLKRKILKKKKREELSLQGGHVNNFVIKRLKGLYKKSAWIILTIMFTVMFHKKKELSILFFMVTVNILINTSSSSKSQVCSTKSQVPSSKNSTIAYILQEARKIIINGK